MFKRNTVYFHLLPYLFGEGNGNPLQCSCLENPRDGGDWWAADYGVAQSWTRLKWHSSRILVGAFLIAQLAKNPPVVHETPGSESSLGEEIGYPLQCFLASQASQMIKNHLQWRRSRFDPRVGRSPWRSKPLQYSWASLVTQLIKNLPAVWETWVLSVGWEDPLEKGMATYSSILAWKIPWAEEPGRLQAMGSQRVGHNWATNTRQQWVVITDYLPAEKYRRKKKI